MADYESNPEEDKQNGNEKQENGDDASPEGNDGDSQGSDSISSVEKVNAIASQFLERRGGGDSVKKTNTSKDGQRYVPAKEPAHKQASKNAGGQGGNQARGLQRKTPAYVETTLPIDEVLKVVRKTNKRGIRMEAAIKMVRDKVDDAVETLESFRDAITREPSYFLLISQ